MKKAIGSLVLTLLIVASVLVMHPQAASATSLPRPVVMDHTLKTPSGDLLRGTNVSYGANWADLTAQANDIDNWRRAQEFGLNFMRITNRDAEAYKINQTENPSPPLPVWSIEDNLEQLDQLVDIADSLGMYVMITPNSRTGTFSKQYLIDFWTQAAPRYKDRTNVFYEMQNEPVQWGASDYTDATIDNLADIYAIMRAGAPDTPILSLCVASAKDDIRPLVQKYTASIQKNHAAYAIDWSAGKDLVSFHPYGTTTDTNIDNLKTAYPAMNTENGHPRRDSVQTISPYTYHTEMFEKKGISWTDFWMTRTDDVFARWTYNLVDDAKVGNYYWKAPDDVITDDLNDLSMTDSNSNVTLATANTNLYDGDTSRITRAGTGTGAIVYKIDGNLQGIGTMRVNVFYNDTTIGVKFYVSEDGVNWRQVTRNNTTPVATSGGWKQTYLTFANSIPVNTNYMKVELVDGVVNQIGSVQFNSWDMNHYGGVDELNTWNFIHSKSSNMVTAAAGDVKSSFESDPDRVMKNSAATGYITYKTFSDVYDGLYLTTFIKGGSTGVLFYTSPDGTNWTSFSDANMTTKVVPESDNVWSRKDYTLDYALHPLPSGTQYIKVEIPSTSNYNNTEIGSFTWWTHYDYTGVPLPPPPSNPVTLFDDNFDAQTTGNVPSGYTVDQSGGSVQIQEVPSASDKSMRILDSSSTQTVNASKTFTAQSGTVTWQFSVRPEQTDKSSYYRLTDNGNVRLHVAFTGSDAIRYWHDSASTYTDIQSYSSGTWYKVKIVANVAANKYDVYINDVKKVNQVNFESAATSLNGILMETGEAALGTMYVDDISVLAE